MTIDKISEGLNANPANLKVSAFRFPYSESELLANMTPEKSHADESANPTETEPGI